MKTDFYINGLGADYFGARLLSGYKVGSTKISRSRHKVAAFIQGWYPLSTDYELRQITLPVYIFGTSARDAAEKKSRLDAAMLADPIELILPNGFTYSASLDVCTDAEEMQLDGRELKCTYTLVGYAHESLLTEIVSSGQIFVVEGTAPEMACRLTCTASADAVAYEMCGVIFSNVAAGDVLVLDGLNKRVTRNGVNDFDGCDLITWPTLQPGNCTLTAPDTITVEYYPIWV